MAKEKTGEKNICINRKARHNYIINETQEAGIVLNGAEVKSLRDGRAHLKDSYGRINKGEAYLINAHISNYEPARSVNVDPTRTRKLLLHKKEIMRLMGKTKEQGFVFIKISILKFMKCLFFIQKIHMLDLTNIYIMKLFIL